MARSHAVPTRALVLAGLLAAVPGCKTAADEACLGQFGSAQAVVMKVEAEDLASVSASVAAVEAARETCRTAGRAGEVEELDKARAQLTAHRDRLVRRNELREKQREIAPEELARLVDGGDPSCPKGQGYLHSRSGKRIVCVGPQPVDMTRAQAEEYFRGRGYRRQPESTDGELRFEYGAELIVMRYEGDGAPRCVILYPPPDRSWQEMTARLTGVAPARLKPNQPIVRAGRSVPFTLEESPQKVVAQIGSCG
jgi:hypothetical protein